MERRAKNAAGGGLNRCWRLVVLLALSLLGAAAARAQAPGCGTDAGVRVWRTHWPAEAAAYDAWQHQAQTPAPQPARGALPDVTVPVVVHVVHLGGPENISDAAIAEALAQANEDFSKTNPDTAAAVAAFQGRYANVGFRLRLARRDPAGNCTTGITRTYSALTAGADNTVKRLVMWDPARYLNIWVCQSVSNGLSGYSTLPCSDVANDGVVVRANSFSRNPTRLLSHELGHFFGLYHAWGYGQVGDPNNCGGTDNVADTPLTIGQTNCNLGFAPCPAPGTGLPILANAQNFMDYSPCPLMFTTGQRAVMRASLLLGCRSTLVAPANLTATGTADGYAAPPCAPVLAFTPSAPEVCVGQAVTFIDYSYGNAAALAGATYAWDFPGGQPATSGLRNPSVRYATGGIYPATLVLTPAIGGPALRLSQPQAVAVAGPGAGLVGAVAESFETSTFPANYAAPDLRNWAAPAPPAQPTGRWQRFDGALAATGNACVVARSAQVPAGTASDLVSPNLDLRPLPGAGPVVLRFQRAYALRAATAFAALHVQFSTDCGATWATAATYPPAALSTQGLAPRPNFVPAAPADWQPLTVPVPAAYLAGQLHVRFRFEHDGGNALFLDDVRLDRATTLAGRAPAPAAGPLLLVPNPAQSETVLQFDLSRPAWVRAAAFDALGRCVWQLPAAARPAGRQALPLGRLGLPAGFYLLRLWANDDAPRAARLLVE